MDQEIPEIGYEAFYRSPLDERIGIFIDITPANRASLINLMQNAGSLRTGPGLRQNNLLQSKSS